MRKTNHRFVPDIIGTNCHLGKPEMGVLHQPFSHDPQIPERDAAADTDVDLDLDAAFSLYPLPKLRLTEDNAFAVTESPRYRVIPLMVLTAIWYLGIVPVLGVATSSWIAALAAAILGLGLVGYTWYAHLHRLIVTALVTVRGVDQVEEKIYRPSSRFVQAQDIDTVSVVYPRPGWFFRWLNLGAIEVVTAGDGDNLVVKGVGHPMKVRELIMSIQISGEEAIKEAAEIAGNTLTEVIGLRGDIQSLEQTMAAGLGEIAYLLREALGGQPTPPAEPESPVAGEATADDRRPRPYPRPERRPRPADPDESPRGPEEH